MKYESLKLNPLYTFHEFVIGPNSRFAASAALAVATNPGKVYNPFFIYGGVGLGKTHVMQAAGHHILNNNKNVKSIYITTEKFMTNVVDSIRVGSLQEMRDFYKNIDLLLVDDVQFLSESESTQEEFFHIFNSLHQEGKQIILTSDRHPKQLVTLADRLRSRFEWGLIADIKAPSLETRLAILKSKAEFESVRVDDEILHFVASKLKSNIRELEGFLKRLIAYSSLTGENLSMSMAKNLMSDEVKTEETEIIEKKPVIGSSISGSSQASDSEIPIIETESSKPPKPSFDSNPAPPPIMPKRTFQSEQDSSPDTVKVAFFYPEEKTAAIETVKQHFSSIIKKHKMKFTLDYEMEQTYIFNSQMRYMTFAELCNKKDIKVAIVLGPDTAFGSESELFGDSLMMTLEGEGISLQLIPWEDLSKDYKYLNLALDITLLLKKK
ncbi:chromosomal replication initiator protein DnaA [Elusimicrobiota bacterium]